MAALRKWSIKITWTVFLTVFILNQTVMRLYHLYLAWSRGWPGLGISNIGLQEATITNILGTVASNIPDLISMVIYFRLWRHFNAGVQDQEEAYGGIWVGEEYPPQPPPIGHQNNEHGRKAVMRALGWHLKLSMIDVLTVVLVSFGCSKGVMALVYVSQAFCFFFVPFLVVKNGFGQLDGFCGRMAQCAPNWHA